MLVWCNLEVFMHWLGLQVLSDGQRQELDASILVPGDIISIGFGEIVPM